MALGWLALGVVYLLFRERGDQKIDLDYAFREADQAGAPVDPATKAPA